MATAKKTAKTTERRKFVKDEGPILTVASTKIDIIRALNWAAQEREVKDLAPFVAKYMATVGFDKNEAAAAERHPLLTPTDYALCRLGTLGDLPPTVAGPLFGRLREAANSVMAAERPKTVVKMVPKSVSAVRDVIGLLDGQIDDILAGRKLEVTSPYALIAELKFSTAQLAALSAWINAAIDQHDALEDPEIAKGYSLAFKRKYKVIAKYLNLIQTDVDTLRGNAKRTRKKRTLSKATINKRTERTINTTLSTLKYQSECDDTRVRSLNPQKLFGASVAVLYNTANRTIHLLRAEEGKTLGIKKQSVTGVDETKSISCKVRSPERYVPQVTSSAKMEAQRIIDNVIKTTKRKASNRIQPTTIIVAAYV